MTANHKVYGKEVSGKDILPLTPVVRPFIEALQTYTAKPVNDKE